MTTYDQDSTWRQAECLRASDLPMSRIEPVLRTAIPVLAIAAAFVVFCSLEMTLKRPGLLSNPPELRAKNHTLSLALHAAIASDGKNSFYFNGQPKPPTLRLPPGDRKSVV